MVGHVSFPPAPDLSFSPKDATDIVPHDDDPMVIQVQILNCDVKRVSIDSGSSADIMYWDAFKAMQLSGEQLQPYHGTLVGPLLVTLTVISQGLADYGRTRITPNPNYRYPYTPKSRHGYPYAPNRPYYGAPPIEKPPPIERPPTNRVVGRTPSPNTRAPIYRPPVETPSVYKPPVEKSPIYSRPRIGKPPIYNIPIESPPIYKPQIEKRPYPYYPRPPIHSPYKP
jgi:hypothetical protein